MSKQLLFMFLSYLALSCQPAVMQSGVPNVPVNIEINLNDISNADLKLIGGYIYVDGGVRGIIIRHESQNLYKAYDRNCTYQPADAKAIVEVHTTGFYIEDTSCGSTFDLSGFPTGGPAEFPLKEYSVSLAGDVLFIFN
jgi:hypothetical protein